MYFFPVVHNEKQFCQPDYIGNNFTEESLFFPRFIFHIGGGGKKFIEIDFCFVLF